MTVTVKREHRKSCPALQAWDIQWSCNCDEPLVARDENGKRVKLPKDAK